MAINSDNEEYFPDPQIAYDSFCVKSSNLLDFSKRLVKKVKFYEK